VHPNKCWETVEEGCEIITVLAKQGLLVHLWDLNEHATSQVELFKQTILACTDDTLNTGWPLLYRNM
jgi:hypothetical protein